MKRFTTLAVCTFMAAATSLFAQPKLEIEGGTTKDWGTVSFKQTPLKADLVLKNTGTELLTLNDPKPGCGCTTAPLEKKELKPGESTVMHVTLNVSSNGPVTKTISVTSNDPAQAAMTVYLKANIERALSLAPAYLAFNTLEVGKTTTAKLMITNLSKQDVTLSDIDATNGLKLNLSGSVVIKAGGSVEVEGTVTPDKAGYFNSNVSMKTTHPDFPVLEFQSYGNVGLPQESKVMQK